MESRRVLAPALVLLFLLPFPATTRADDGDAAAPAGPDVAGAPIPDGEAKELAKALDRARKKKKAADVLPALEAIGLRSHPEVRKPLLACLTHDAPEVAMKAAEILRVQRVEDDKERQKLVDQVWKLGWSKSVNRTRLLVRTHILLAVSGLQPSPLDDDRYRVVEDTWRTIVGDPRRDYAPAIVDICRYVRDVKDKRFCRLLAEEIDRPEATDVNSPTNPPAEWWERRWQLWHEEHASALEALEDLTGKNFKTTADAKAWFEANEATFGFHW